VGSGEWRVRSSEWGVGGVIGGYWGWWCSFGHGFYGLLNCAIILAWQ
jgi:hypothetical protein